MHDVCVAAVCLSTTSPQRLSLWLQGENPEPTLIFTTPDAVVPVSALTGHGLDALRDAVHTMLSHHDHDRVEEDYQLAEDPLEAW